MIPLAAALVGAGHEVAFATASEFTSHIEQSGFLPFSAGLGRVEALEDTLRLFPELVHVPAEEGWRRANVMFAGVAARTMVHDLLPVLQTWKPQLLVHETSEFGGPIAARLFDIPWVHHSWGVLRPMALSRHAGEIVAPIWQEWGLKPDDLGGHFAYLYLDICPRSFQAAWIREVSIAHPLRPIPFSGGGTSELPTWIKQLSPAPTVYVTLGTVFNEDLSIFMTILDGLQTEDLNVVVTVGRNNDPASLASKGKSKGNVVVERYIDQTMLLPYCSLVVTHGGPSTTFAALGQGLPLLMVPQGADQFRNAERCVATGAGRRLLPREVSDETVRREVRLLLRARVFRESADRIRHEIEEMPGPGRGVELLEELAEHRIPLT